MSLILLLLTGCEDGSFSFGSARDDGGGTIDVEDCDDILPGEIVGPDCLSGTLSCDETITDSTEGGESSFQGSEYQVWYCIPSDDDDWQGSERVYEFIHPGTGTVTFNLSSPCGDLQLFAMAWSDEEVCPYAGVSVIECESGSSTVDVWNNSQTRYLIIVDGEEDQPFSLSASCLY
ncbi:MAG: hypothetical protein ACI8RZ_007108 [Myxococcota bacterium]|jgi:hypothetical protein